MKVVVQKVINAHVSVDNKIGKVLDFINFLFYDV